MRLRLAPEVQDIADDLIYAEDARHTHLRSIRMRYLFLEKARVKNGMPVWGSAARLAAKTAVYAAGKLDKFNWADPADCECFELMIGHDVWSRLTRIGEQTKFDWHRWLVNHLLSRCILNEKGKMTIIPPDVALFFTDADAFGMDVKAFRAVLNPLETAQQLAMDMSDEGSTVRDEDLQADPNAPTRPTRRRRRKGDLPVAGATESSEPGDGSDEVAPPSDTGVLTSQQVSDGAASAQFVDADESDESDESDDAERSELAMPLPGLDADGEENARRMIESAGFERSEDAPPDTAMPASQDGGHRPTETSDTGEGEGYSYSPPASPASIMTDSARMYLVEQQAAKDAGLDRGDEEDVMLLLKPEEVCKSCGVAKSIYPEDNPRYCEDCRPPTPQERLDAIEEREESRAAVEMEDGSDTPPEVSGFLERSRQVDIGATEDDVPMVREAKARRARSKDSEVAG